MANNITYNNSHFAYHLYGHGRQLVFCFHGYGEKGSYFSFLAEQPALAGYCFIAPDLPWHGSTEWNGGDAWHPGELGELLEAIVKQEGKEAESNNGVCLLGFSLGGRLALQYYQLRAAQVKKLVLLAPDGLKVNFWYWFSTRTWPGRRIFRFTMKHPQWFFAFLKVLNKLGTVNSSIFKFVNYYISDKEARQLLYNRWTCLRLYKPDLETIKQEIKSRHTTVRLVYGQHDRIILTMRGEKFIKDLGDRAKLKVIASGHQVLHEKHADDITDAILY